MDVGTSFTILGLGGAGGARTTSLGGNTTTATSLTFGPPAQVSINESSPTVVGFRDYTTLGASGVWQFNLQAVLNPSTTSAADAVILPPEQQEAEAEAVKQALAYVDEGNYAAARQLMNDLLANNKTNAAAVHVLGYADLSEGKFAEAEQLFLKAHAMDPAVGYDKDAQNARILQGDDESVLRQAQAMARDPASREESIRILISLTQRSPDNVTARVALAEAMLDQGDAGNGLMQYGTAVRLATTNELPQIEARLAELAAEIPESAFVRQLLGKAQLGQGRYGDAVATLTEASKLGEGDVAFQRDLAAAYVGLGREALRRNDVNTAQGHFQRARELDPTGYETKQAVAEGHIARAEQLVRLGRADAALTSYRKAADLIAVGGDKALRQRGAQGAFAVGRSLERKRIAAGGEISGEALAYQIAYELSQQNTDYKEKLAETRNAIGDQLIAEGDYLAAAQSYRRAYDLFSNNETYKNNTINAFVAYADWRLYNLNYDDAIERYREAFAIDTSNTATKQKLADAYNARGVYYREEKDYKKAVLSFKEALRLFPNNATYQANYNALRGWDV